MENEKERIIEESEVKNMKRGNMINLFEKEEIEKIKIILEDYINENTEIKDSYVMTKIIDDNTDFERHKYSEIEKVLKYHIRHEKKVDRDNLKNIILWLEKLKKNNINVFTQENIIASVITAGISLLITVTTGDIFLLIVVVYMLFWAYLSKYIGLKKGIDSGYTWGYFLGLIGFVIVCVLQGEGKEQEEKVRNTRYKELEILLELKEKGAITQEEFEIEKKKILK